MSRCLGFLALALCSVSYAQSTGTTEKRHGATALLQHAQPTSEIIVRFRNLVEAEAVRLSHGLQKVSPLQSEPNTWVLRARSIRSAQGLLATLRADRRVLGAEPNMRLFLRKDFTPNDPYYAVNFPSTGWPGQWTLNDTTSANLDVEAPAAWAQATGTGIVIGIVDDGFEINHPDLSGNYQASTSFNFGNNTTNPNPVTNEDNHGTAVAGIIAARGGNNGGITGIAPLARWSGLRVDFANLTTAQLVDATQFQSTGTNPPIRIKNQSYGPTVPYADGSAEATAMANSVAAGTIHVRSAGNLRGTLAEDANKAMVRNSVNSITVAAIDSRGRFADYSAFGANVFVTAPSGAAATGTRIIFTTDRFTSNLGFNQNGSADIDQLTDGAYTSLFGNDFDGGTSVASGLVAGALALAEQVQPNLNQRMAKHLLARTARQVDPTDTSPSGDTWRTNNAGLRFNQNYGFGLLDAGALVTAAQQWNGVSSLETASIPTTSVAASIPDNNTTGLSRTFTITNTTPLEEVLVTLNVTHAFRGDLEAFLTSPRGTRSRLFATNLADDGDNLNWTFSSNAFWGEAPNGVWTLQVRDLGATDAGTWNSYSFEARMGQLTRRISGSVTFGDISANNIPVPVTFALRNPATQALLAGPWNLNLTSGQTFQLDTSYTGPGTLYLTTFNWLRRGAAVNLTSASTNVGALNLINGEATPDGEVDLTDIDTVIANYLQSGPTPLTGDLDWTGEVDLTDIDIAIANYLQSGD